MQLNFTSLLATELAADPDVDEEPPTDVTAPQLNASPDEIENQIRDELRIVSYAAKEYTIEELVRLFERGATEDTPDAGGELFVPSYQREFVWENWRQSRFVESILIGLPIPQLLFAQEVAPTDADEGRLEIVDGSQRVRTLWNFLKGNLVLRSLTRLSSLNGKSFKDLLPSRQRKFARTHIRVLEVSETSVDDVTLEMFLRINQGSLGINEAETRRGAFRGELYNNITRLADDPLVERLIPVQGTKAKRREREELILRFFAYTFAMEDFKKPVAPFLEDFVKKHKGEFPPEWELMLRKVLYYVDAHFPDGFRKSANHNTVPRVRFEAIAVGIARAMLVNPDLPEPRSLEWLQSTEFRELTSSDGSNSAPRLRKRLNFVRDALLAGTVGAD